ncbi:MAG TPA: glycosyltransferase [Anaerolineales bacterium]
MKIAIPAPTYIPARRANTVQVMKMAQAFVHLGHQVHVMVPGAPPVEDARRWETLANLYGLEQAFPLEWLPAHPRFRRYDFAWRAVQRARAWGADVVYTRLPQAAALSSWRGIPTVLEIHDLPQGTLGPLFFKSYLRGRGARRLVVISEALLADVVRQQGAPASPPFTIVAPDGVDLRRYAALPAPEQARAALIVNPGSPLFQMGERLSPGCFTAGYTGHLYPGRGGEMLLEIAARLPEVTFLMVGGEPQDVARLREAALHLGLRNVILTGFVPNAELPLYQAACDVLMMPYQRRVAASSGGDIARYLSPMKLFEYLACGRAILSSDLPVLREVLSAENAVLLPPEDVEAWAAAIRELKSNPERTSALAARARQEARRYTWEARASRILEGLHALERSREFKAL